MPSWSGTATEKRATTSSSTTGASTTPRRSPAWHTAVSTVTRFAQRSSQEGRRRSPESSATSDFSSLRPKTRRLPQHSWKRSRNLDTAVSNGRPKRHQPLTLLWALGRAAHRAERLVPWNATRAEISALIREFGLEGDRPTPEYPVLKLTHFGLWTLPDHPDPPRPSGSPPLAWMSRNQPISGLREWVYHLVTEDQAVRSQATAYLLSTYFQDVDQNALLIRVGLGDINDEPLPPPDDARTPERRPTTIKRIVRDSALSLLIKTLHDHTCQICGVRLLLPNGPYAEGAHIRPLGHPHDGHDVAGNLLCLCPNDHVLFDQGAITIKDDLTLINRLTGEPGAPYAPFPVTTSIRSI